MDALSAGDLHGAFDVLARVMEARTTEAFARALVEAARDLVPADVAAFNDVAIDPPSVLLVVDPPMGTSLDRQQEAVARHLGDHPLVRYYAQTGDPSARRISDFLSDREFRGTGLYHEVFKPVGTDRVMSLVLSEDAARFTVLVLNRDGAPFAERDRQVLDALRPHLVRALHRTRGIELAQMLRSGVAQLGAEVVVLDDSHHVHELSEAASRLLERHTGQTVQAGNPLPPELGRFVRRHIGPRRVGGPAEPAATLLGGDGSGDGLGVRLLAGTRSGRHVLLLTEQGRCPTPGELRVLGLTGREAEVLALASAGRRTGDIAAELFISPNTVKKHLERIYRKLDVSTRSQAVAVAVRAARDRG